MNQSLTTSRKRANSRNRACQRRSLSVRSRRSSARSSAWSRFGESYWDSRRRARPSSLPIWPICWARDIWCHRCGAIISFHQRIDDRPDPFPQDVILDLQGAVARGWPDIDKRRVIHPLLPRLLDIDIEPPNIFRAGPVLQQRGLGVGVEFAAQGDNFPGHVDNAFDHFPVIFFGEFDQGGMVYSGVDQLNVHGHIVSTPRRFDKKMFSENIWT